MPLNKQRGNMYPWITHTYNPIRGCLHGCIYCYVKSIPNYNSKPRLVEKELTINLSKDNTIFIGSASDMFGDWIPDDWIKKVLKHTHRFYNTYLFQTKNPRRFKDFYNWFPYKTILGTTIETNRDYKLSKAPLFDERVIWMQKMSMGTYIFNGRSFDTMVSIEPIVQFDLKEMVTGISAIRPKFVSIGADSKDHGLLEPSCGEVWELLRILRKFTEVRIKNNLRRLL